MKTYTARADDRRVVPDGEFTGVCSVASYQMSPETPRPFNIHGVHSGRAYQIEISLTAAEARKLIHDFTEFLGMEV